jgi:hypothetical protein
MSLTHWKHSLRQSFRLLPTASGHLRVFLDSEGKTQSEVLANLPYDAARSSSSSAAPDSKRYRDPRYVYESIGLLFEDSGGRVQLTDLGKTTKEWLPLINEKNCHILCRHVAYALSAVQLRNPTRPGQEYPAEMEVFPIAFIWRAMLALKNRISSDELNRVILQSRNLEELNAGINRIREVRISRRVEDLGQELITGTAKNDRIIPWMAMASFGWTCIHDKDSDADGFYTLKPRSVEFLRQAVSIRRRHRDFTSVQKYVEFISRCATLPPDLR